MNNIIIAYGLLEEQRTLLESALSEEYDISTLDCITDLIVTDAVCTVINAGKLSEAGMRTLLAYYMDVGDRLDETVVWLGNVDLPKLPSFVQYENYLQLLLNCEQVIYQAQSRYDTMQQYTDIYSYLPEHAIAECLEADVYAALECASEGQPDVLSEKAIRREWVKVLEMENGPEFLASVYELCRWLKKSNIFYRLESSCFDLIDWVMGLDEPFCNCDDTSYTLCISRNDFPAVENWLQHHWYFQKTDERLQIKTVEGMETGIASLDLQIMGLRPGEVILVGGRPAMGKSSFAKGVAEHVAKTKNVLFFDLEECGCVRNPNIQGLTGCFSMDQIYTAAEKEKPDLLIIDRFQRIPEIMDDGCHQTIMGAIKRMAQRFQIPVLVTTDLSRDIEERPCSVPCEKDIPAYSVISQFVDTVLLLCRPAYYDPELDRSLARMYVPKAKRVSYPYCTVRLRWDDENNRFTD